MKILEWAELKDEHGESTGVYEVTVKHWLGGVVVYHGNPLQCGFYDLASGKRWRRGEYHVKEQVQLDGLRNMVADLKRPTLKGVD